MDKRIHSIDFVRGLVMVIMAIDHVRDLMHVSSLSEDPTNVATTTPFLFFTRFITHFCAPTFVFLSGTSAYLSFKKQIDVKANQRFLLSRGLWLILLEYTIVNFGIWYNIHFSIIMSQVIGAIGFSFIILAALVRLSPKNIGIIGLVIIFGHDLLTPLAFAIENPSLRFITSYLFASNLFQITPHFTFLISYPIIPWLGIMLLGYASGLIFELSADKRRKLLFQIGISMLVLFTVLRWIDIYGDGAKWSVQKDAVFTFLSFINVSKYPPSLFYTLVTLGVMMLVLASVDTLKNKFVQIISVYGKVPLFYYLIHWYLVHTTMIVVLFLQGFTWEEMDFSPFSFGRPKGISGVELPMIYLIWLLIVIALFPLCKWYGDYKMTHKENKWLRYL